MVRALGGASSEQASRTGREEADHQAGPRKALSFKVQRVI